MTRYFQLPEGGIIRGEEWLPNMGFSASYPEVQVVPLDAIVIRREEFAARPVLHHEGQIKSGGAVIPSHSLPEYAEDTARHYLALAQWLRENPPVAVDEALKSDLEAAFHAGEYGATKVAAFLAERGWTKKTFAEQFNEHFTTGPGAAS